MRRCRRPNVLACLSVLGIGNLATGAWAQTPQPPASAPTPAPQTTTAPAAQRTPDMMMLGALKSEPLLAPYPIATSWRNGRVLISGRVGTRKLYDLAIAIAIATRIPYDSRLSIDTSLAHQVAGYGPTPAPMPMVFGAAGVPAYVYPPPLFGRVDDPFYGMEPPVISYPPWWGTLSQQRLRMLEDDLTASTPQPLPQPAVPSGPESTGFGPEAGDPTAPPNLPPTIQMDVDARGIAVLRGRVPTLTDKEAIAAAVARMPNLLGVINKIQVDPRMEARPDVPPPPPQPIEAPAPVQRPDREPADAPRVQPVPEPGANVPGPAVDPITARAREALKNRPSLAGLNLDLRVRDGIATLEGRVPSAHEAMVAHRAVAQTPGVREVIDRLEFPPFDGRGKHPLIDQGRPEDIEAYLLDQIRAQVGPLAHVERVKVAGETVQVRLILADPEDRARAEAILRSMPLLRGLVTQPEIVPAG